MYIDISITAYQLGGVSMDFCVWTGYHWISEVQLIDPSNNLSSE